MVIGGASGPASREQESLNRKSVSPLLQHKGRNIQECVDEKKEDYDWVKLRLVWGLGPRKVKSP